MDTSDTMEVVRPVGRPRVDDREWDLIPLSEKIKRVERLEHVLTSMTEQDIDKHFDMSAWGVKTKCGTVGCAAGLCALDPWFRRRGFGAKFYGNLLRWTGQGPLDFFGGFLYNEVYTSSDVSRTPQGRNMKPRKSHRLVVRAIRAYLRELRSELREAA